MVELVWHRTVAVGSALVCLHQIPSHSAVSLLFRASYSTHSPPPHHNTNGAHAFVFFFYFGLARRSFWHPDTERRAGVGLWFAASGMEPARAPFPCVPSHQAPTVWKLCFDKTTPPQRWLWLRRLFLPPPLPPAGCDSVWEATVGGSAGEKPSGHVI